MKKFVKITTREGDAYIKNWIDSDTILQLVQNSITQEGVNEGTIVFQDGTTKDIISFAETITYLN
jgi:hypothetical protein